MIDLVRKSGGEFLVNTQTSGLQGGQTIHTLADGGFFIAWVSDGYGTRAQRFDAAGNKLGGELALGAVGAVSGLASEGFVVASFGGGAIEGNVFDPSGNPVGNGFTIQNAYAGQVEVFDLPSGGFVVSWWDQYSPQTGHDIRAQVFDAVGTKIGPEILVNSATPGVQNYPTGVALASGDFIITWTDQQGGSDDPDMSVRGQRFDATGNAIGGNFLINTVTASAQAQSDVAALATGGFVVTWQSYDGTHLAKAQIFDAAGNKVGPEILASTLGDDVSRPSVTTFPWGGFLIAWNNYGTAWPDRYSERAQLFDGDGNPLGSQFRINTETTHANARVEIAALASGQLIATWMNEEGNSPTQVGVKAQVFSMPTVGTAGADTLNGGAGDESFAGLGGDDVIHGRGGADAIEGNAGNDTLAGDAGADAIDGGAGFDTLYSSGVSPAWNAPYASNAWTAPVLDIDAEMDTLNGGEGDDSIFAGYGDRIDGGAGFDILYLSLQGATSGVNIDFSALDSGGSVMLGGQLVSDIDAIGWAQGSNFDDTIRVAHVNGNEPAPVFGMGGNDRIYAGYYTRYLDGGDGDDLLDFTASQYAQQGLGGAGNDTLIGGNAYETMYGGIGNDMISGNYGFDYLHGEDGDDTIDGGSFSDNLYGGVGKDTLYGAGDADEILGEDGDDILYGDYSLISSTNALIPASNSDRMFGGNGADIMHGDGGDDFLWSGQQGAPSYPSTGAPDNGTEHDQLFGDEGNDTLSIGYGDDADGGSGTDSLSLSLGGLGAGVTLDTASLITGGTVTFGGGTIAGIEQIDTLYGTALADNITVATQGYVATIFGGSGADTVTAGGSGVYFHGGAGADTLVGGSGFDSFFIDAPGDVVVGESIAGNGGVDTLVVDTQNGDVDISAMAISSVEKLVMNGGSGSMSLTMAQLNAFAEFGGILHLTTSGTLNFSGTAGSGSLYLASSGNNNVSLVGMSGVLKVYGADGNDLVTGSTWVDGAGGDDQLTGTSDYDILRGGTGNDWLEGGAGTDELYGGADDDTYVVDASGDYISEAFGEGSDTVRTTLTSYLLGYNLEKLIFTGTGGFSGTGNDLANTLTGGSGADILSGMVGNDLLDGGAGADSMAGGAHDDIYVVDNVGDAVTEAAGAGNDRVHTALISYTLTGNVEQLVYTGSSAFAGTGNELANIIDTRGASGNDTLKGMAGADTLYSGAGNDSLDGGTGVDSMTGGAGDDTYQVDDAGDQAMELSGEGNDTVRSTAASYVLGANIETLILAGAAKNGTGNAQDNVLIGNGGHNILDGGAGADRMEGGAGDDTYHVDNANDLIVETGVGLDKAVASVSYTLRAGVSVETLTTSNDAGTGAVNLKGNELANRIVGNAGANTLNGGGGNDRLEGLDGSDTLWGDAGNDLLYGGNGNDLYVVTDLGDTIVETATGGTDRVSLSLATGGVFTLANYVETLVVAGAGIEAHGNAQDNRIVNSATGSSIWGEGGNDTLEGGAIAEALHGGIGNDRITGNAGNDTMWGDAGNDLFVFATGSGADEVVDFTRGADRIDLTGYGISSLAQVQGMMSQSGANAVIDLGGGNSITLDNIVGSQLAASDFVFAAAAPALAVVTVVEPLLPTNGFLLGGPATTFDFSF